jgi:hypothetical protein
MRPVKLLVESSYTACPLAEPRSRHVLELRIITDEVGRRTFREWVIRAHHRHWNLVRVPGVGQTDDRGFVQAPPLEMRQFKSRGQFIRTARQLIQFAVSQIGISGSAPASSRATNGFSIETGAKPLPPLRASWRSLAPDERVFNNR